MLGDIAKTAARIDGSDDSNHDFEKKPVRILVSERTRPRLGDAFLLTDRGEHSLKGKAKQVRLFEVMGEVRAPADSANPYPGPAKTVAR